MRNFTLTAALCAVVSSGGCASNTPSGPKLYPNEHLRAAGPSQADADVRRCQEMAAQYTEEKPAYKDALKSGVVGGALGAGTGAIAGTIMKEKVGRATAAGAAVGSILGIANELKDRGEPDPSYKDFVEHCLRREGYEVMGWT